MNSAKLILFAALLAITAVFIAAWVRNVRRNRPPAGMRPTPLEVAVGFVTNFFDTLGIGSFAPTTSIFKLKRMVPDERILSALRAHLGDRLNPALRRLADVPEGSTVDWSPGSLFPVVSLENVAVLPGPPVLFKEGFARIRDRYRAAPIFSRALYFGVGEGTLAEHLDATVARFPSVSIGSYPRFDDADHRVKVTFDGRDQAEVRRAADFLRERVPAGALLRED